VEGKTMSDEAREAGEDARRLDPAKARKAMKDALRMVKKLGAGAGGLLARLKKDKSPEAMLATLESSLDVNRTSREEASGRIERLFREVADKKKAHASAPKARQRVLEMELRSRLSEYKATESELKVLLENEQVLCTVKGRLHEIIAHNLRGISEVAIDRVIDDIEDSVSEADAVLDAAQELEKAGRRRTRETDEESLWDELSAFDEGEPPVVESEPEVEQPVPGEAETDTKADVPPEPEKTDV